MRSVILYSIFFYSAILFGQDAYVSLEINPTTTEKGVPVTVTIKSNVDGNLKFDLPKEFIQSGASHSGMKSSVNYQSGKGVVEKYSFQQFSGHFEKLGEYILGPVELHTKEGIVKSDEVKVKVVKSTNMISENPSKNMDKAIFGIIEQSKKSVYEGEPLLLEAKVYAQIDVIQVDDYKSFKFQGPSEDHKLQKNRQVTSRYEKVDNIDVITFKLDKTVVFPEKSGTYEVSPFLMMLYFDDPRKAFPERTKIVSNETSVKVKPLPANAPSNFLGAVGNFDISAEFNQKEIKQGRVVELMVRVEGAGNLHNITAPKFELPKGAVLYGDPEVKENISFTQRGAEGEKVFTYFIQINESGELEFDKISMAFFNIKREVYEEINSKPLQIKVLPDEKFVAIPEERNVIETVGQNTLKPFLIRKETSVNQGKSLFEDFSKPLLGAPILLGFVLGLFVRYKRNNETALLERKVKKSAKKKALDAIELLKDKAENSDDQLFFSKLQSILLSFIATKWNITQSSITREVIIKKHAEKVLDKNERDAIITFFDKGDQIRFGAGLTPYSKDELMTEIIDFIHVIDTKS